MGTTGRNAVERTTVGLDRARGGGGAKGRILGESGEEARVGSVRWPASSGCSGRRCGRPEHAVRRGFETRSISAPCLVIEATDPRYAAALPCTIGTFALDSKTKSEKLMKGQNGKAL